MTPLSEERTAQLRADADAIRAKGSKVHVYFAVPTSYTIGSVHDTYDEAVAAARDKVCPLGLAEWNGGVEQYSRAFVDVRVADEHGDRSVQRIEVLHDGELVMERS